jgi:hypothetical protein
MNSITMTERSNVTSCPQVGDYVIANNLNHKVEGYITSVKWEVISSTQQWNLMSIFNPMDQTHTTVRHTVSVWSYDPYVDINWFF